MCLIYFFFGHSRFDRPIISLQVLGHLTSLSSKASVDSAMSAVDSL